MRKLYHSSLFSPFQAYVQTNADNIDRDVQTEERDLSDKWCQHPPEGGGCCGGR